MISGFKQIVWTDHAKEELDLTLKYLEDNFSEREICRLVTNIESTLSILSRNPQAFPASGQRDDVRRAIILGLNSLYYRVAKDQIEILSFFSNRQDPGRNKY